ncbi:Type 1 phosphatases regulator YPI1 [Colletotrichum spinosum]|uniref:Type 1 phosphatases regulator n=1 Tax=Colletotrichum spinosum TaxID=1347390 RepID=A0A4R8Q3C6_9PEZI|nr:Type 1 phosphatases regulator YPI1 [Colletotrichum spinosum]
MAAVQDPQQRSAPGPSQTQTETPSTQTRTSPQAILRLRGAHAPARQSVRWAEDVVDNEGLGRKSSKVCCIYHRPKAVDESSDESSSDSSSDSDSDSDGGGRRRVPSGDHKGKGKSKREHKCGDHDHDHDHDGHRHGRDGEDGQKKKRRPSPNAYERVPKPPKAKEGDSSKEPKKGEPPKKA